MVPSMWWAHRTARELSELSAIAADERRPPGVDLRPGAGSGDRCVTQLAARTVRDDIRPNGSVKLEMQADRQVALAASARPVVSGIHTSPRWT